MFSLFKKISSLGRDNPDTQASGQYRMGLDERKAYRREMLYQSIRESMLALEALSSMYKFKVINVDERHHRFVVMIEVAALFQAKRGGVVLGFSQIEEVIRKRALERHGVVLEGMFWRVNEAQQSFARANRTSDTSGARRQREAPGDAAAARLSRFQYEPVSEQERAAFEEAVRRGQRPPAIHVGAREYQSERAPLETTPNAGGTQYGEL